MSGKSNLEKRVFSTVSTRAAFLPPATLTALDWRVLIIVALHDGMSMLKQAKGGKGGPGCVASYKTLARECQCSYSALLRTLKKLQLLNLIEMAGSSRGQKVVIRVRYDVPDNVPQAMVTNDELVTSNDEPVIIPPAPNDRPGHSSQRNGPDSCGSSAYDYSSLRGELDYVETLELDSPKERDLKSRRLPQNFFDLEASAQVAIFERTYRADSKQFEATLSTWSDWLFAIHEDWFLEDEALSGRALRLHGELTQEEFQ